ncbi:MAG: hypothetical protein C0514_00545 [Candidatus Puniceispirillum sp.]|nr:hypothetical protein [Candidatus Puniceispirillum sp.]
MRKEIFAGMLVFASLASTVHGSASSAAEGNAFNVTVGRGGCPELKLGDPLFVYIHERYKARQEKETMTINGEKWIMSTLISLMGFPSHTAQVREESISTFGGPPGECSYQYSKGMGVGKGIYAFSINLRKAPSIDEEQKNKDMSSLRGYLHQLKSKFPALTQDDFLSAVKGVF